MEDEPFNPEYTEVDRCLDVATQTEPNGEVYLWYMYICIEHMYFNYGSLTRVSGCDTLPSQMEIPSL